jgi:hypothetical protein
MQAIRLAKLSQRPAFGTLVPVVNMRRAYEETFASLLAVPLVAAIVDLGCLVRKRSASCASANRLLEFFSSAHGVILAVFPILTVRQEPGLSRPL